MAEVTGLRNNALPYPVYGVPYGLAFPLLDADGDPVSPSSPDSEVSKNGDTFADCTNEAVEIATSSGICYLLLTAAEMTADVVTVRIQSTGAKTTVMTLYPAKLPVLASGTSQGSNDTGDIILEAGSSALNDIFNGCLIVATIDTVVEARLINDYVGSTLTAEVSPAFVTAQPDSNDTYVIYAPLGRAVGDANVTGWLATAPAAYSTARGTAGTALPAAAADDAGGLPISDAGGLDLDSKLANTNEITVARMGALTDWINGGRLDLLLDGIIAVQGALNDAAADGDPTTTDTLMAYQKQLINILIGSAGIVAWPASAAPGNGVSLAEAIRYSYDQLGAAGAGLTAIPGPDGQTLSKHIEWISAATHGECAISGSGPYTYEYYDVAGNIVLTGTCQDGERTMVRA